MTYFRPIFVSELNDPDGHVEDCVWTSGLMQANASSGGLHPATIAEAEALRAAGGAPPTGGSSSQQLIAGTTKRYGFAATIAPTPATIIAAAKPGQGLTVSGHLSNFPAGHTLRRFSPDFTGGHRIYCQVDAGYWWMDPLAPPDSGYKGQSVTLAQLTTFAQGGQGGTVAPLYVVPAAKTLLFPGGKLYRPPVVNGSPTLGYSNAPSFRTTWVSFNIAGSAFNPWYRSTGLYSGYIAPRGVLKP